MCCFVAFAVVVFVVDRCSLFVACCSVCVVRCLCFVVCCLLVVGCCSLRVDDVRCCSCIVVVV